MHHITLQFKELERRLNELGYFKESRNIVTKEYTFRNGDYTAVVTRINNPESNVVPFAPTFMVEYYNGVDKMSASGQLGKTTYIP